MSGTPLLNSLYSELGVGTKLWLMNSGSGKEFFGSGHDFGGGSEQWLVGGGWFTKYMTGISQVNCSPIVSFSALSGLTLIMKYVAPIHSTDIGIRFNYGQQALCPLYSRVSIVFDAGGTINKNATSPGAGKIVTVSSSVRADNADGVLFYNNGVQIGATTSTVGKTGISSAASNTILRFGSGCSVIVYYVAAIHRWLTPTEHAVITSELNSISYPTSPYEIWTPDYPTVKEGTPSFNICCGSTTDQAAGITPTTATAVASKKDTQMADYLQFTRTSSPKLDYGIQTQNQLNYEFEWDGDVYFDTDAVGQITEVIKVGDSVTGVCFGLRKTATEKFQFIYGADATVDFTYSVPSLGPLHIVLRREWVSGTTYDVKLWVNGSYVEKVTGAYAGTGNASAKTYIGYSGNITNTNFLSGRIYYSVIYPHLRPVEKFQKNPFSKNMILGWGVRANNTVNTVERDTDNVVTVVSGGATFKVNSGFGDNGKLQKWLETGASAATFRIRNISSNDGLTVYYRALTTRTWTEGNGSAGDLTVDATGLFTLAANRAMLWSEL